MAHLFYGCTDPSPRTVEYPVNASDVFAHAGANFVILGSDGYVTPALTTTATLFGYAIITKGTGAGTAVEDWKASATDGADKVPVILATDNYSFFVPADATATIGQSGDAVDLVNASATDSTAALVDVGTATNDVLIIQELAIKKQPDSRSTASLAKLN